MRGQLKLPKGTLKGRLEQGRALLRERLVRRGLGPAAALVASAWSASDSTALSPTLLESTTLAAARVLAGQALSGFVSAKVVTLSEGVVNAMFRTKLKIAAALLLTLSVFGAGVGAIIQASPAGQIELGAGSGNDRPPAQFEPEKPDADRAAAEWVIGMGGRIRTAAGFFGKGDPLGDGPFHISAIELRSNDKVKDEDLARFKDLTKLNNLFLAGTPIGDAGLKHLAGLPSLESHYLPSTKVGDAGLAHLKGMTGLVNLYLDGTQVTDAGLAHRKALKGLKVLYLRQTPITDAGLKHLRAMPQLSWVELWDTKVTDAGVKELQAALPTCTIKNVKNDRPPPAPNAMALPVGKWSVEFANGVNQTCEIRQDGTASVAERQRTSGGKAVAKGGSVEIAFEDDRVERWTPVGKRFIVEHWFPAAAFPNGTPERGIADRTP